MGQETTPELRIPSIHEVLVAGSDSVNLEGVLPVLMTFAAQLAYLHFLLFGIPLVITSGKDANHPGYSFHDLGRALDFRTYDKTADEMQVFLGILAFAAPQQECRVFDERVGASGDHVHLEYLGQ